MSNSLIIVWRNVETRTWTPVGKLSYENNYYYFNYTNGAKDDKFIPFGQMRDKKETYVSNVLFPIFYNRLLSKSRPEYEDFLNWLDIDKNNSNDILELSRSRGIRATDELQLFPMPEKDKDANYEVLFFAHGISHLAPEYVNRLSSLKSKDELLLLKDIQNKFDKDALMLRTQDDPVELLGYCPAFFVKDFNKLMEINGNLEVKVTIQKVNHSAPSQLKLLCKLSTKWPDKFTAFDNNAFEAYKE